MGEEAWQKVGSADYRPRSTPHDFPSQPSSEGGPGFPLVDDSIQFGCRNLSRQTEGDCVLQEPLDVGKGLDEDAFPIVFDQLESVTT